MASLQQPIRVRLQHDIMPSVDAVQYDTDREFHFVIDDYEIPVDTTDIRIYIEKPSGYALYNFGSLINGEVVYQPTPQTLAEVGTSTGQVQIIKNKAVLTSFPFKIEVQKNLVDDDNFSSGKEFLIFDELIKTAEQRVDNIDYIFEQEDARVEAEKKRVSAENNRITKENQRQSSENSRVSAENDRVSAEKNRASSENTRVSNEKNRENNETSRKNAESKRATECENAITECNNATKAAKEAINSINTKLDNAIDDSKTSSISTYSSNKIMELFANQMIASKSEPSSQLTGGLWLKEE